MSIGKPGKKWVIVFSAVAFLAVAINIAINVFSAHADIYLGRGKPIITQAEGTETWPSEYYKNDYADYPTLQDASNRMVELIEAEGLVLLKNDGVLPLAGGSGPRVTLLGRAAADPVYAGSGSGSVDLSSVVNLKTALESRKFAINPTVYAELEKYAAFTVRTQVGASTRVYEHPRANIAMDRPANSTYDIGEMPVANYSRGAISSFASYDDAAIVSIARAGGEGGDLTQNMKGFDENYTSGQHQLELNKDEKDVLALAKANFKTVIVLINSSSAMELGDLKNDDGIDAILWIGSPGQTGLYAVADALVGAVTPSGRTVDIYPVDFTKDPTFVNFGNFKYRNVHGANAIGDGYFVQYEEGIYYGYRYYETAAKEGFIDYDAAVAYPFGYGLSYADFSWEITDKRLGDVDGSVSIDVKVTNTGSKYSGKDVVQLYYSAPYVKGGLEKSEVVLGDFAKTKLLAPGESDTVTLSLAVEDMASYDWQGKKAYVLDAGTYALRVQNNSHELKEGIAEIPYAVQKTVVYSGANRRASDKSEVTNRFDDVSSEFSAVPTEGKITVMSRADFAGTFPTAPKGADLEGSDATIASFGAYVAADHQDPKARMPVTKKQNGLSLIDMRGRDFDDPAWDAFLDQIDPESIAKIVLNSAYNTEAIPALGKPATVELDGPAGISAFMGDIHGTAFPSEVVIASTYNVDLGREMGIMIGNEGLHYGVHGWYAPAVNIHRSPFAGRNFEYYSEDPVLSGKMATCVIEGAAEKGVYAFLKHFALNDQESNRNKNGVATWANEQAIREIYLKPFEIAVKNARVVISYIGDDAGTLVKKEIPACTAIMSSFNRIGAVWTGGSAALMQDVLRDEWGFSGVAVSDFNLYPHMFVDQGLAAGTDFNITFDSMKKMEDTTSATAVSHLRRTAHRLMYTIANSNAMNGLVPGTSVRYTMAPWRIGLIAFDILVVAFLAFCAIKIAKARKRGE